LLTIHCTRTGTRSPSRCSSTSATAPPVWQKTLDELGLGVPCLVAVVYVVHRHGQIRLAKHSLHHYRVVPVFD